MIDPTLFVYVAVTVAILMLLWDTVEVGRNDAANIVNAVFGARILKRRMAVYISGFAVVIGACISSGVMETARKGIFDPTLFTPEMALAIYVSVYITDTILLYTFSSFGMPVSTTAQLIFGLLGGAFILGGPGAVQWDTSTTVILSIVASIFISGIAGFIVQKIFRGVIGDDLDNEKVISIHGPWIAGLLTTGLFFFMIMKGMKNVEAIKAFNQVIHEQFGYFYTLVAIALVMTVLFYVLMFTNKQTVMKWLFPGLAIIGMIGLAIAFGQNDLANCASPGVASYMIFMEGSNHTEAEIPLWLLFGCGVLLFLGMTTKRAQRVTRSEVNTGSQGDIVRLYAPQWCISVARLFVVSEKNQPKPKPEQIINKTQHYDALRAAVITSVSASVIAFASGMKMPVSTTYVTFAAVISTGWADRIFSHGDAALKLGRTIWVVFTWFFSAFLSAATTAVCVLLVYNLGVVGILLCLSANFFVRQYMKSRSDRHEEKMKQEANERKQMLLQTAGAGESVSYASEADDDQL